MKHTPAGRKGSAKYNNEVRYCTLRYATVGHLRSPPKGFEEVALRHYALCRQRIVVQARRWMLEARDSDLYPRYQQTYAELLSLLDTESMREFDSLPPLPEDLALLEKLDPSFNRLVDKEQGENFNPWAESSPQAAGMAPLQEMGNAGLDDEIYE